MKVLFPGLIFFLILLSSNFSLAQQLKKTEIINSCVTEYTMGSDTEDEYVVIVFTCNSTYRSSVQVLELTSALVVGGGGGGGKRSDTGSVRGAGGGGAGGVTYITDLSRLQVNGFIDINVEVGIGGEGSNQPNLRGLPGSNSRLISSTFPSLNSKGGGGGGSAAAGNSNDDQRIGGNGGSGGGGVSRNIPGGLSILVGPDNTGTGNRGGEGAGTPTESPTGGGGGGGVASEGQSPAATKGGEGGEGRSYPQLTLNLPASVPKGFAGGGGGVGGNSQNLFAANGGSVVGVGVIGGDGVNDGNGKQGMPFTGSGGGAGGSIELNSFRGGNGARGIVIIRYDYAKILPVYWLSFTSQLNLKKRSSSLKWSTTKEWENSHFEIERSLDDAKTFEKIGQISGMGWTDEITEYSFEDDKLPLIGGNIFYRLKQVDFNGRFDYSDITALRIPNVQFTKGVWRAYPNPTVGSEFNLELVDISQYHDEAITMRMLSSHISSDAMIFHDLQELSEAVSSIMANAPSGLWICEIQWGNKVERIKVMKR